jgi:A/G-specific adenine glycosylase
VLEQLWTLAERCTPRERAGAYNQGMMDLGATLCTRANPGCAACPVTARCLARVQGRQRELPAPKPRQSTPTRTTRMLAVLDPTGEILLERRPATGIWGGLWSLPETGPETSIEDWCRTRLGTAPRRVEMLPERRHTFSHYHLRIELALIELGAFPSRIQDADGWRWIGPAAARTLGLPAPVSRILADLSRRN